MKGWVAFRYERLPNFCYWCGCLDHGEKDCDVGLQQRQSSDKKEYQFGAWLRATSDHPPYKTVVIVPGNQPKCRDKSTRNEPPKHQPATETEELTSDRCENGKSPDNTVDDPEYEMEIEHNPVFPILDQVQKSNAEIFNDQLKEIDQAINYMPYGENTTEQNSGQSCIENLLIDHGLKSAGPKAHSVSLFSSPTRRPLKDISNGPCNNQEPKSSITKWKKLAIAHKPTSGPPTIVQPLKRDHLLIEEDLVQGKRLRAGLDQCNFGNTFTIDNTLECMPTKILAAAGSQPCRKP
jgi:hypothetical protein